VTLRAAAKRYARALFDVALAEGLAEPAQRELRQFADLVRGNEALWNVVGNPAIPAARKHGLVKALLDKAGPLSPPLAKLLLLLADRDRLLLLPELADAYDERVLEYQKVIRGGVTTAVPLDAARLRALEESLGRMTGRRVTLTPRVDPSIIGGVVAKLGSTVYDGSVATQLEKMKESLIARVE
jgi:F-type H+-transporting ATPase subunit delta